MSGVDRAAGLFRCNRGACVGRSAFSILAYHQRHCRVREVVNMAQFSPDGAGLQSIAAEVLFLQTR